MVRLSNEIIEELKKNFVSSDQIGTAYIILNALYYENYDILDKLDDDNKDRKMIMLYRDLVYKGYLVENEDNEDGSNILFSLTSKAKKLIEEDYEIEEIVKVKQEPVEETFDQFLARLSEKEQEPAIEIQETIQDPSDFDRNEVEDWIKEWIKLFPVRAIGHSYPLRTGKGVCASKMRMFLKNNPHITVINVFDATKLYLEEEAKRGWQYTTIAGNFISKSESGRGSIRNSLLETYCDKLLNPEEEDPNKSKYSDLEDNDTFL